MFETKNINDMNFLRPNGFRFMIHKLPKVVYFCQSANIPDMSLGVAIQATPLVDVPHPGEKLTFGSLNIEFIIQEDMSNYRELYEWMIGVGFPKERSQFTNYTNRLGEVSDASLVVLGSNFEYVTSIVLHDCFPVSLSGVQFTSTADAGGMQYLQAKAEFRFTMYELEPIAP